MSINNSVTCFLPCRSGSKRIKEKNTKHFLGHQKGLFEIKIKQLVKSEKIENVVVSTDDDAIIKTLEAFDFSKIVIHQRDTKIAADDTSTDTLIHHAAEITTGDHILWTHVTSPFFTTEDYNAVVDAYFNALSSGHDSLFTATAIQGFIWDHQTPVNYDRKVEKWPRTQTLKPLYEINSAAFLATSKIYRTENDRIGNSPYIYEIDNFKGHDIDWPEDFAIAECLYEKGLISI